MYKRHGAEALGGYQGRIQSIDNAFRRRRVHDYSKAFISTARHISSLSRPQTLQRSPLLHPEWAMPDGLSSTH
jgi:hypothetical protein